MCSCSRKPIHAGLIVARETSDLILFSGVATKLDRDVQNSSFSYQIHIRRFGHCSRMLHATVSGMPLPSSTAECIVSRSELKTHFSQLV
ncbi:hypothetical protein BAUCODRAFT_283453 [Baudoinia panamericana UAMH 10762]|uniref:Uncharacterized protein n=1 Tax=Baudoinia panamericana (strain UAMH 10762) TaxID=717646 RepID=M2N0T8_BAUPA|nr:uncharacterized protein BAUCODRAFT_283453 [Baudoinia panamericana UAMH 10762]EMC92250.1 hypothetical protein BAUCODRAFT_283453 [Baudoinia panamericana UAMH 10762]